MHGDVPGPCSGSPDEAKAPVAASLAEEPPPAIASGPHSVVARSVKRSSSGAVASNAAAMASREADDAKAAQRSKLDAEAPRLRTHHAEVWINGHDPYAYLRDVLERLPTQAASRIGELLPHRWQTGQATA